MNFEELVKIISSADLPWYASLGLVIFVIILYLLYNSIGKKYDEVLSKLEKVETKISEIEKELDNLKEKEAKIDSDVDQKLKEIDSISSWEELNAYIKKRNN